MPEQMHANTTLCDGVEAADTLPIYLNECHVWSDGEDEHDEDHNSCYDLFIVFLVKEPTSIITFSWNARSTYEHGMISQWIDPSHLKELQSLEAVGHMPCAILKRLVHEDVGWHERSKLWRRGYEVPPECIRAAQVVDMM
jgi:hypothetical protein